MHVNFIKYLLNIYENGLCDFSLLFFEDLVENNWKKYFKLVHFDNFVYFFYVNLFRFSPELNLYVYKLRI